MDRRSGKRFANYSVKELEYFLKVNPSEFNSKRGIELLVGCILARCSELVNSQLPDVGYMVKGTFSNSEELPRPSLKDLFENDMIEDLDVDIWLQTKTPVQITRFDHHRAREDANQGLLQLIKKKLLVSVDDYLQLVILADHTFDLDKERLTQYLDSRNIIPYKRIYLIGQFGDNPRLGQFCCREIYPETRVSNVRLDI